MMSVSWILLIELHLQPIISGAPLMMASDGLLLYSGPFQSRILKPAYLFTILTSSNPAMRTMVKPVIAVTLPAPIGTIPICCPARGTARTGARNAQAPCSPFNHTPGGDLSDPVVIVGRTKDLREQDMPHVPRIDR